MMVFINKTDMYEYHITPTKIQRIEGEGEKNNNYMLNLNFAILSKKVTQYIRNYIHQDQFHCLKTEKQIQNQNK